MTRNLVDPFLGKTIDGRFLIQDKLGEGSMGGVYRALDQTTGAQVALKVIHRHLTRFPNIVERFRRELAITAGLDNPWTVRVHAYSNDTSRDLYLAMELLQGRSLHQILRKEGRFSPERVAHVGAQVARGLADAHARHVIHRDLKPENVMLVRQGDDPDHVKILDFGVARIVESVSDDETGVQRWETLTRVGAPIGTLQYMSPQQIACEPLDHLTDLYSLGIVLFEMATGKAPFQAQTPRQALQDHLFKEAPALAEVVPGFPGWLDQVIHHLLAKEPEARPQTALEVARMLEHGLSPPPVPALMESDLVASATLHPDAMPPDADPNTTLEPPDDLTSESARPAPAVPVAGTMVPEEEETLLLPPVSHVAEAVRTEPPRKNLAQRYTPPAPAAAEASPRHTPIPPPRTPEPRTPTNPGAEPRPRTDAPLPRAQVVRPEPADPRPGHVAIPTRWLVAGAVSMGLLFLALGVVITLLVTR